MKKCNMQRMGVIICVSLTAAVAQAVQKYQVIDLGQGYWPQSFNENGQVVLLQSGSAFNSLSRLSLWQNGQTTPLYQTYDWIQRAVINNSGTIAASVAGDYGSSSYSLVINGDRTETLPSVYSWDMNDSGQISSATWDSVTERHYTHLRNPDGSLLDCDNALDFFTTGVSINNHGQIAGASGNTNDDFSAFVWDPVTGKRYLSPLAGDFGALGMDINAAGMVVGYSAVSMGSFPEGWDWNLVMWDADGQITELGCKLNPMGKSVSLNDAGQFVGSFKLPEDSDFFPYFRDEASGFIDAQDLLDDDSPWTITSLTQINNLEEIIGIAIIDGQPHGVLLIPIPEPGTLSLVFLGMVLLRKTR